MPHPICECGFSYVSGDTRDERLHRRRHKEFVEGPTIAALSKVPPFASLDSLAVKRIDATVPMPLRAAIAAVAQVARRETPDYKAGYDGTMTDEHPVLYVAAEAKKAVAMVLVADTSRSWRLRWVAPGKACLISRVADEVCRPKVGRLWVASGSRRSGIARRLVAIISSDRAVPIDQFAWQLPFSHSGGRFVRALIPSDWLGDGDLFDLEDLLTPTVDGE